MKFFKQAQLSIPVIGQFLFWIPVILLSGLLSFNALHYYTFDLHYGILPEKTEALKDSIWTVSFYLHMLTGAICLFIPIILFTRKWYGIPSNWHRTLGKIYILVTLVFVCPTGLYMSFYAKGGMSTTIGFILQGILLFYFTYTAFSSAINKNFSRHAIMMVRSFSVAAAVVTFRLLHIIFYLLEMPYEINYAMSQWVGLTFNILISEMIIAYKIQTNNMFNF